MEEKKNIRLSSVQCLSYAEIAELHTAGSYIQKELITKITNELMQQFMDIALNKDKIDVAFRLQVELQDGMNLVALLEQIPIHDVIIRTPTEANILTTIPNIVNSHNISKTIEPSKNNMNDLMYHNIKLNIKDRLKILFKGGLK